MAYPATWPPVQSPTRRSLRFFVADTATDDWVDFAYIFADQAGATNATATPVVVPGSHDTVNFPEAPMGSQAWSGNIRICNDSLTDIDLEYTFDGDNVQGVLKKGEQVILRNRWEAGIAVRGDGADFRIESW